MSLPTLLQPTVPGLRRQEGTRALHGKVCHVVKNTYVHVMGTKLHWKVYNIYTILLYKSLLDAVKQHVLFRPVAHTLHNRTYAFIITHDVNGFKYILFLKPLKPLTPVFIRILNFLLQHCIIITYGLISADFDIIRTNIAEFVVYESNVKL